MTNLVGEKITVSISQKINSLPISTAENPETRNALQKINDNTGRAVWSLIIPISTLPNMIFTIISAAIPIFYWNPLVVIPCILLALPNIIVGIQYSKAYHDSRTKQAPKWRIWAALEDFALKGKYLYENKILGHVDTLLARRTKIIRTFFESENIMRVGFAWKRQGVSAPVSLFETGAKVFLYYQAIISTITLGTAQITSNAISSLISNVTHLIRQASDVYQNYLFIADYEKFMALPEDDQSGSEIFPVVLSEGIEFRDVWFKYNSSPNWILKGASFKLGPTDNLAIVGENGAGKSTIIKLLCRFYEPQKGEIFVNGINIKNYNLKDYLHHLSALFQDFAQYPFSANDNIHFGDITQKPSSKNIKKAAKLTGMDDFINSLPDGYKNPLDKEYEKGIEPSKGQWQRIALARVLFRPAPIIILDEPTSNVDPESEEQIFADVLRVAKDKIVFLVSHRFSTVRKADKILVLEKGVVVEYGSHDALMKLNGRYKELFLLQAQSYQ
jgi:ATP-binding cassette subfamily B protein